MSFVLVTGASTGLGLATVSALLDARHRPGGGARPVRAVRRRRPGLGADPDGGDGAPDDLVEGHRTQVWLATADEGDIEPRTGGYWHHRATREPHRATRDERFRRSLLAQLADRTGISSDG